MLILSDGNIWNFLSGIPWWAWISILAIVGASVQQIMRMQQSHRERLAMIQRGLDPGKHEHK